MRKRLFRLWLPVLAAIPAAAPAAVDPPIAEMLAQVDEQEIMRTSVTLQDFTSRAWGQPGNVKAAAYLHERLGRIPGLTVAYQGGETRNVIATLPGADPQSTEVYLVGAHYDSLAPGLTNAPGATDNAAGVGVVLEYARILSRYRFQHTIQFACWNREETGLQGSAGFVDMALTNGVNIKLYINNDSCCFDPDNRLVLDLIFNAQSRHIRDMMVEHAALYQIGFRSLTENVHKCGGDHSSFWRRKCVAVSTHQEDHGAHYHTPQDTVEKINARYARMNAQIGMSVIARLARPQPGVRVAVTSESSTAGSTPADRR